jgi:hypothetical protein
MSDLVEDPREVLADRVTLALAAVLGVGVLLYVAAARLAAIIRRTSS